MQWPINWRKDYRSQHSKAGFPPSSAGGFLPAADKYFVRQRKIRQRVFPPKQKKIRCAVRKKIRSAFRSVCNLVETAFRWWKRTKNFGAVLDEGNKNFKNCGGQNVGDNPLINGKRPKNMLSLSSRWIFSFHPDVRPDSCNWPQIRFLKRYHGQ